MIKMLQKSLLLLWFSFLLASSHTTVINNNIDPGGLGPLNSIFAHQFKRTRITQVKLRVFYLKGC